VGAYVDDQVEGRQKGGFGGKERTEGKRGMPCISSALYLHDISHIFSLGQEFLFRWIALAMAFKSCVGSFSQLGMHGLYPFGACKEGWHVRCKMYECKEGRC
jgi:hypothetical protein